MTRNSRTILVTGGNRGLGLETCWQLARAGDRVLLASRDETGVDACQAMTREGLDVAHRVLDVASTESIAALARRLSKDETRLDVLVNNAGIAMQGFDANVARRTLDVNFFGPMHVTDALLPFLAPRSHVLMVTSGLGELACVNPSLNPPLLDPELSREALVAMMHAFPDLVGHGRHESVGWPSSAYRVSKVGLNALVRVLARDLAPRGVRVNAVCPGWVRTALGGSHADRDVEEGARSIVAAVNLDESLTGGFFRDGAAIPW